MSRADELLIVLSRATRCHTLSLLEYAAARGRLTSTTWSRRQRVVRLSGPVSANDAQVSRMLSLPLLRPTPDGTGLVVVTSRSDLVVVGWELRGVGDFDSADALVVTTLLPLLVEAASVDRGTSRPAALSNLTRRETDILLLVGQGLTATAAARRCGISPRTVNKHLEHAYRKIGCHDRVSAMHYLTQAGLLTAGLLPC